MIDGEELHYISICVSSKRLDKISCHQTISWVLLKFERAPINQGQIESRCCQEGYRSKINVVSACWYASYTPIKYDYATTTKPLKLSADLVYNKPHLKKRDCCRNLKPCHLLWSFRFPFWHMASETENVEVLAKQPHLLKRSTGRPRLLLVH